jgi:hypothetical protein
MYPRYDGEPGFRSRKQELFTFFSNGIVCRIKSRLSRPNEQAVMVVRSYDSLLLLYCVSA